MDEVPKLEFLIVCSFYILFSLLFFVEFLGAFFQVVMKIAVI